MSDVKQPRQEYIEALADVCRNRAAVAGERAVKAERTKFLPPLASMCCNTVINEDGSQSITSAGQLTTEGTAAYNKMLALAYFYGATGRTVDGLTGLIFSKEMIAELPSVVEYLKTNVDSKGNSLRTLAKTAAIESFISPRSGFLVARPSTPEGASKLDEEQLNLRPKILHYQFESIINWDYEVINNEEKLSLLVLKESVSKRDGFKIESVDQYRVLELIEGIYHQSLYDCDGELIEEAAPVIINGQQSNEIPFYEISVGTEGKSVINDLVDANFHHYQVFADYACKNHYSSFIIWYETGADSGNNMMIGNGVKWSNPQPEATFGVLQPDGNADSLRLALKDTEERMAALGAEQLKPRVSGAESAEAKSLDQVAQNSTTGNIAITVSEALTKAINFASRWMGGSEDTEFSLNTDYNPTGMNPMMVTAQLALVQSGEISSQTFYENLQKGEIASSTRTFDEERDLIEFAESEISTNATDTD